MLILTHTHTETHTCIRSQSLIGSEHLCVVIQEFYFILVIANPTVSWPLSPPAGLGARSLKGPFEKHPGQSHVHPGVCSWWKWHFLHFWARPYDLTRGRFAGTQVGSLWQWGGGEVFPTTSDLCCCRYHCWEGHGLFLSLSHFPL